jgi:hypothetical protein
VKSKWELECRVRISSRNSSSGEVESAFCASCCEFGKVEPEDNENRKRKRTQVQNF